MSPTIWYGPHRLRQTPLFKRGLVNWDASYQLRSFLREPGTWWEPGTRDELKKTETGPTNWDASYHPTGPHHLRWIPPTTKCHINSDGLVDKFINTFKPLKVSCFVVRLELRRKKTRMIHLDADIIIQLWKGQTKQPASLWINLQRHRPSLIAH